MVDPINEQTAGVLRRIERWRRGWRAGDLLVGLSLANLTFLRVWSELLTRTASDGYTMRHPARPVDLAAVMTNVVLLGLLMAVVAAAFRQSGRGRIVLQWGLLLYMLAPLNAVRTIIANSYLPRLGGELFRDNSRTAVIAAAVAVAALCVSAMIAWREQAVRMLRGALAALSVFVLVTFSQAVFAIVRYQPAPYRDGALATRLEGAPKARVLWLIFDELDERMAFVNPPAGVRLPEFERLRSESISATHAYAPASITLRSLPSLITGRPVKDASEAGPADLLVTFEDGQTAHWQDVENVFSRARKAGFNTALAGWYHPYCRVLNDDLTDCAWAQLPNLYNSTGDSFPAILVNQARSVAETSLLSPFGQSLVTGHHVRSYEKVMRATTTFATDPRLGLVLAHFPIPHPPYIYNSRTAKCDLRNSPVSGYADALELADRSLGELRRAMEAAGLWDRTTVLVTADHGYRTSARADGMDAPVRWVPFLLKLAGRQTPRHFDRPLETVVTSKLLLDILQGRVATISEVGAWLAAVDQERPNTAQSSSGRPK